MTNSTAKAKTGSDRIAENRKARHDYFIEEQLEAGLSLEGWEVKSLRAGRGNLAESYAVIRDGQIFLLGAHIAPLPSASTHIQTDPVRTRRLLLHRREIDRLIGAVERKGYTARYRWRCTGSAAASSSRWAWDAARSSTTSGP